MALTLTQKWLSGLHLLNLKTVGLEDIPTTNDGDVVASGDSYYDLRYSIVALVISLGIGTLFLGETKDIKIHGVV